MCQIGKYFKAQNSKCWQSCVATLFKTLLVEYKWFQALLRPREIKDFKAL